MKFLLALSSLVAFTLASPLDPNYVYPLPHEGNEENVTFLFSNDFSSHPDPVHVTVPLDGFYRNVGDAGSDRYVSSILLTDQSSAPNSFSCDVYVVGRLFDTLTTDHSSTSLGRDVLFNGVSLQCRTQPT
ncbi:hypothetical protein N7466_006336 [Penicillium verhagenii]|uniref:uncharacterized protein n=1 Tax=Penicillium verhagenii TaxID=1562060 RepID=UPI00254599EC|nr:uncharacterized protein N7466_006336 [Penicillium verhagenii]KAJ5930843.1 hypothetical protein N7466_006336 [Penicillium verhagenii]